MFCLAGRRTRTVFGCFDRRRQQGVGEDRRNDSLEWQSLVGHEATVHGLFKGAVQKKTRWTGGRVLLTLIKCGDTSGHKGSTLHVRSLSLDAQR